MSDTAAPAADGAPSAGTSGDGISVSDNVTNTGGEPGGAPQAPQTPDTPAADTGGEQPPASSTPDLLSPDNMGQDVEPPPTPDAERDVLDDADTPDDGMSWLKDLPDEFKDKPSVTKYASLEELLKGYENLSKLAGKKALIRPNENSTAEEWAAWNELAGVPTDSSQYKVPEIVSGMNDEQIKGIFGDKGFEPLLGEFHKIGMNQDQINGVSKIFDQVITGMGERHLASEQAIKDNNYRETVNALREEWGKNYKPNLNQVKSISESLGITELAQQKGWSSDKDFLRVLHKISTLTSETSIVGTTGAGHTQSFDDAIKGLKNLYDKGHIDKPEYQKRRSELYKNRNIASGRQDR